MHNRHCSIKIRLLVGDILFSLISISDETWHATHICFDWSTNLVLIYRIRTVQLLEVTLDKTGILILIFFANQSQLAFPCRGWWREWTRCGQRKPRSPGHGQRSVRRTEEQRRHCETHHAKPRWGERPGWSLLLQVYFSCLTSFFFTCVFLSVLHGTFLHLKVINTLKVIKTPIEWWLCFHCPLLPM